MTGRLEGIKCPFAQQHKSSRTEIGRKFSEKLYITLHEYRFSDIGHLFSTNQTHSIYYTGRFIMFSVITNIYNKKTKGPTLMELFTATGNLKKSFLTTRDVRCVHHG